MDSFTKFDASYANPELLSLIDSGRVFEASEAPVLLEWMELSRYLTDVYQLFDMYRWNVSHLVLVPMYTSGRLCDVPKGETIDGCRIKINAVTMSIITSGVNLVDARGLLLGTLRKSHVKGPILFEGLCRLK